MDIFLKTDQLFQIVYPLFPVAKSFKALTHALEAGVMKQGCIYKNIMSTHAKQDKAFINLNLLRREK